MYSHDEGWWLWDICHGELYPHCGIGEILIINVFEWRKLGSIAAPSIAMRSPYVDSRDQHSIVATNRFLFYLSAISPPSKFENFKAHNISLWFLPHWAKHHHICLSLSGLPFNPLTARKSLTVGSLELKSSSSIFSDIMFSLHNSSPPRPHPPSTKPPLTDI